MGARSDLMETIERAKDTMTARRVFGEPLEKDGVTIIPAARVQGGAGGGGGEGPEGEGGSGMGSAFGMNARPVGAFVIKGEDVQWRPAVDVNKVILGGQLVAVAALLLAGAVVRARKAVLLHDA
ncbi:MAG TPA: spore germination protein GerW family protein [Actinomycetota bacterium]|nr:spore germination protein GerW family protein [Actinomycetota bacterium]